MSKARHFIEGVDVPHCPGSAPRRLRTYVVCIHRPWWHPGPKYYVWLRWLTGQSRRCEPPDPKPWERTQRRTCVEAALHPQEQSDE